MALRSGSFGPSGSSISAPERAPNHQGDGNALTPESLARRAAAHDPAAARRAGARLRPRHRPRHRPPPCSSPTWSRLQTPTPSTDLPVTPPTTSAPVVDPRDGRDGSGRGDRDPTGVRAAQRAHVPHQAHIPQLEIHGLHLAAPRARDSIASTPSTTSAPQHHLPPGRRSSTSRCSQQPVVPVRDRTGVRPSR